MPQYHQVASLLIDIELELRKMGQWQKRPPSPQALASEQPFCVDTLEFQQWLQFVFIPRIRSLIEADAALPGRCGIAPMAEEFYRGSGLPVDELIAVLHEMDELLSANR